MNTKQHEMPEFQVIRQNEANAKFFVASFSDPGDPKGFGSVSYDVDDINGSF